MNVFNRAITSPFSIFRKKSDPLQPNPGAIPSMLDGEEEEDGFTIVGQSWSERNTLYPQNRPVMPPPSYQQVSSTCLPPYEDVSRSWSEPLAASGVQMQQTPNRLILSTNTEYNQPHTTNCCLNHPYLHDVPFVLSPRIDSTEDTFYMDCLPHLDLSELTYDFSVEHQVLSHALLKQCDCKDNDIVCDDNSSQCQEEHLIQQFGQQAVVTQEMFDFIGMESKDNQCSSAEDLISFVL